jgi:hypothetical protein
METNDRGEYISTVMTAFLEMKDIIHDLSPPYAYDSNGLPGHMNHIIAMIVRSMTLDYVNEIPHTLWAKACSIAVHIKNRLTHSTSKLNNHYTK